MVKVAGMANVIGIADTVGMMNEGTHNRRTRTEKRNPKRFVRYAEGAEMYSMSESKFMQIAKDAKACYKVNQLVLVNLDIIEDYLESFHIVDDYFYKM